ncbi:hypothetical protein K9M48_01030 [Candidatus Gracilibacteria bacterium]|nr:hypothetical protein [Candidatus Gracilibacteria bacterium]
MGKKDKPKGIQTGENNNLITERIESQQLNTNIELIQTLITQDNSLPLENYTLDQSGITICSSRGGTIPSLILDGVEIFYNDPVKRNDFSKSIREGFWMGPQAGPFTQEQNEQYGYNLKQHGFLRDLKRDKKEIEGNKISYEFNTNQDTLKAFPHNFTTTQEINLGKKGAYIGLIIENKSDGVIRFAPGHHTYYKVSPDQKTNIKLSDNMGVNDEMKTKRVSGQETIKIKNPGSCQVFIPGTGLLQLNFDEKFKDLRLRTEKEKGFVCIEPVVCHPNERNNSSIIITPKEQIKIGFTITLLSKDK